VSVAVALTISDGFIVGVDSAVTISFGAGKTNIYEDAEKIFQLGERRIGIATLGLAGIGERSIGSFIREFEFVNFGNAMDDGREVREITESLRDFFYQAYAGVIIPAVEALRKVPFQQVAIADRPSLGLIVGGYSDRAFLPEVWEIRIPEHSSTNSAQLLRAPGVVGVSWHAVNMPIHRYINGIDPRLRADLETQLLQILGRPLTGQEASDFEKIFGRYQYQFVYNSMPITSGIRFVRHLVDMVIEHYRVVAEDSIVGGEPRIGVVTYKGERFRILS
jgi:hypothetical protein